MRQCLVPLQTVMAANGADGPLTVRALTMLDALMRKAGARDRRLAEADSVPSALVEDAIVEATGYRPARVLRMSVAVPFPRPDWMTDESYRGVFRESLGRDLGEALAHHCAVGPRFWRACEEQRRTSAWMEVHDVYYTGARTWLTSWAYGGFPDGLGGRVETTLDRTTRLLLGCALLGDADGMRRITPLMELFSRTIPVARKKGDETTLITLVA